MTYYFIVESAISLSIDVEADSLAEAVELARAAPVMNLCHQCARGEKGSWNTSGELDCDPASAVLVDASVPIGEVDW